MIRFLEREEKFDFPENTAIIMAFFGFGNAVVYAPKARTCIRRAEYLKRNGAIFTIVPVSLFNATAVKA